MCLEDYFVGCEMYYIGEREQEREFTKWDCEIENGIIAGLMHVFTMVSLSLHCIEPNLVANPVFEYFYSSFEPIPTLRTTLDTICKADETYTWWCWNG